MKKESLAMTVLYDLSIKQEKENTKPKVQTPNPFHIHWIYVIKLIEDFVFTIFISCRISFLFYYFPQIFNLRVHTTSLCSHTYMIYLTLKNIFKTQRQSKKKRHNQILCSFFMSFWISLVSSTKSALVAISKL